MTDISKSVFQELFSQRAQGFQIDFRFRNAPPRPPVGPTFVGNGLNAVLHDSCQQYKPLNSVEVQHKWKLHSEPYLGVPLAPSAMDVKSFTVTEKSRNPLLHPDDAALLDWTGHMGDTASDMLKAQQERKRIKDRLLLTGKKSPLRIKSPAASQQQQHRPTKKDFSRVLNEGMQTWMKKTTYLSNDYTRKVHDFKSLAQTKQELAQDLQLKQDEMTKRRSATAVSKGFAELDQSTLQHPLRKQLKPKTIFPLLPNIDHWGLSVTHVVLDKAPTIKFPYDMDSLKQSFIGNVEKIASKSRMGCQFFVPDKSGDAVKQDSVRHEAIQSYDLEVVPLKDEDAPHANFVISIDRAQSVARYLPVASRVQLSRGRPIRAPGGFCFLSRRSLTSDERLDLEERAAEVNSALAEKHGVLRRGFNSTSKRSKISASAANDDEVGFMAPKSTARDGEDEEDDDFGDDSSDSSDDALFGSGPKAVETEG